MKKSELKEIILSGGIVESCNRYYKYNNIEKSFYYVDYSINNDWKKSSMKMSDFLNIQWNIYKK